MIMKYRDWALALLFGILGMMFYMITWHLYLDHLFIDALRAQIQQQQMQQQAKPNSSNEK